MLRCGLVAFGEVLLDLQDAREEVGLGDFDYFTCDPGVHLQALLISLVAREFVYKLAEIRGSYGNMPAFKIALLSSRAILLRMQPVTAIFVFRI